jgi:tetratricopeptide (TPR) repeat protein
MKRPSPFLLPLAIAGILFGLVALSGCAATDPALAGAREHLRQGDFEAALEQTDLALQTDPDNAQIYVLRAEIFSAMADAAATEPERRQHVESMAGAYRRAQTLDPQNRLIEVTLMQIYGRQMNAGVASYQEGANARQDDPPRTQDAMRSFTQAAASFERAALVMPDSASAHLLHGLALLEAGETTAAAEPLERAVALDSESVEAYFYLGRIYLVEDRADNAISVLERGVRKFPEEVELRSELLNAYARTGQIDRAISEYGALIDAQPDDPMLRYNYGSFLLQARRFEEAATQLEAAATLYADTADRSVLAHTHYNLGASYLNQAIELHEEWAELDADSPQAEQIRTRRDTLLEQAIPPLERARELFGEQHNIEDACTGLFRAYALLLRNEEAREAAACAGIELD